MGGTTLKKKKKHIQTRICGHILPRKMHYNTYSRTDSLERLVRRMDTRHAVLNYSGSPEPDGDQAGRGKLASAPAAPPMAAKNWEGHDMRGNRWQFKSGWTSN